MTDVPQDAFDAAVWLLDAGFLDAGTEDRVKALAAAFHNFAERRRQLAALMRVYQSAVIAAAQKHGTEPKDFGDAVAALPPDQFKTLRTAYAEQVAAL